MVWAPSNGQRGFEGEAQGVIRPRRVALERRALPAATNASPQPTHSCGYTLQIDLNQDGVSMIPAR